ncbi:MAG: hypothetical protein IKO23_02140 [Bacteroidales bacterium]|nr:hypothetical protein [Bacteroidales bacterium]
MPIKKKIFLITALFYILYLVFPLFADTFSIPVWLPSIAVVAVMVVLYPKAFANKTFYWFLAYAVVLGLYVIVGKRLTIGIGSVADNKKIYIEFAYILPTISIFSILCYLDDYELTRRLVRWSVVMLFVSFIITVPLMIRYNSIREALKERDETFTVPGLPGYSLMHAYTLFLPALCYAVKLNQGWKKWLAILGIGVLCFVIYDTFVTTSLLMMIAILLFTVFYTSKSSSLFVIIAILLMLIVYILYQFGFFVTLIDWIMPAFEGTAVENKLIAFKDSMLLGQVTGGSITARQNLHARSWNSFFQNPIFGTSVVGGHSSLIDRFGGMGLVAGLPFVMIFVSFIKRMVKLYDTMSAKMFFWIGIIVGFVFLYQKGNWGNEAWLMYMVLMPMGILVFEKSLLNSKS